MYFFFVICLSFHYFILLYHFKNYFQFLLNFYFYFTIIYYFNYNHSILPIIINLFFLSFLQPNLIFHFLLLLIFSRIFVLIILFQLFFQVLIEESNYSLLLYFESYSFYISFNYYQCHNQKLMVHKRNLKQNINHMIYFYFYCNYLHID